MASSGRPDFPVPPRPILWHIGRRAANEDLATNEESEVTQGESPAKSRGEVSGDRPPVWDLSDLYAGPDAPEIAADLERADSDARAFAKKFEGRIGSLDGGDLGRAIEAYEALDELLSRLMSYAGLHYAAHVGDPEAGRFFQGMREKVTDISAHSLFFVLELNRIEDERMRSLLGDPGVARFAPWIRDQRVFRPHQLDDKLERLLHDKSVTGRAAWMRLFDETMAALRFPVGGRDLTSAETLHLLADPDREKRRAAAQALGQVLGDNAPLFAHITNTIVKDKAIEDKWRGYPAPISARNLGNHVEDDVVAALVAAVKDAYPRLSHRYYALKARWLGGEKLDHWDRNAPLPDARTRSIPWSEARDTVLAAYDAFSPDLAAIGRRFFDRPWIDAETRPGKDPGAFAHSTVPSVHPYLLMNYQGRPRDVMTLAHELGHGVHQILAGSQGQLMAETPLTLAETASVFGEMLTFRSLLAAESDPAARQILLAEKVEDMLNTVVRQVAFCEFETRVHAERRNGELSLDWICDTWLDVQRESLGPALRFDDGYRFYWTYIPHFVHTPFYVYAYAFGDCLVNSLYSVYLDASGGFQERYLDMLRAGGTRRHRELLAPFGLDAGDPDFWRRGLAVVAGLIDEIEALS